MTPHEQRYFGKTMSIQGNHTIIFRADGNSEMGLGHIFRSMALARMLNDEYHCICATKCDIPVIVSQLQKVFFSVYHIGSISFEDECDSLRKIAGESKFLVLDGYHFNTSYHSMLEKEGLEFCCIEDIHAYRFL